jgi:GxxExxY protein
MSERDPLTHQAIGAAMDVHRELGPGLLEAVYEECLAYEFKLREIPFERQVPLPVVYKGVRLDLDYRMDLVVANGLVLELKAVDKINAVHEAQLLTYLRLSKIRVGLRSTSMLPS